MTRTVTGSVIPQDYELRGRFVITTAGDAVVLQPQFPELSVRVFVDPSEEAWAVVDGVVKEQRLGCEMALNKVDLKEKLGGILGRGFNVKIPQKILKPVALPAGVRQSPPSPVGRPRSSHFPPSAHASGAPVATAMFTRSTYSRPTPSRSRCPEPPGQCRAA